MYLYYFVQLLYLFNTRLSYSTVGLDAPMSCPSVWVDHLKSKESRNGRKSRSFQKYTLVQQVSHATNTYIRYLFEPRSRFARRANGFRRISIRSTVSAHCCYQRTNTTHHTATTHLRIACANTRRHNRSVAAGIRLLRNKYVEYAGIESEGRQTQGQNTITKNFHTVMEIDIESEGRFIYHPRLQAKIYQSSFNRQRDFWTMKSYRLKYIGKPGAGQHHPGYEKRNIEVLEVIIRHARDETISIQDWQRC
ncbi:MAG: hypothetical protein EZS28_031172 [Streblomastix strix]|uniref:Uncharacterized protein n=1 Tax=Streblomastix strix TaxID=222440 RepID=A0A5J4UT85_9EUKA|nr:MAG: hypothetical protein EZS28_031172 [Streblomastix strix]